MKMSVEMLTIGRPYTYSPSFASNLASEAEDVGDEEMFPETQVIDAMDEDEDDAQHPHGIGEVLDMMA
jgi:hypothetical protein